MMTKRQPRVAVEPSSNALTGVSSEQAVAAVVVATEPEQSVASVPWCLYLIECSNGAYYAGISNNVEARYAAHVGGRGARYTRANPPLRLLGARWFADRSAAAKAEWQIRQLRREDKLLFLAGGGAASTAF